MNLNISGSGGGDEGGGGGQTSRASVEAADSLRSRTMVGLLDLLGEGQIGGLVAGAKSIYLDNTPLQNEDDSYNFSGITWDHREGTQAQTPIDGFSDVESPISDSVQVKVLTPHTITITNPNVSRVRVIVTFPSLVSQDSGTGDINGTSVQFKFSISTDEGPFVDGETITVTGKSRSKYQKHFALTMPLPGSTWKIRMTRITADSTSANLSNDTWFDSYVEIVDSKLSYPNSAIVSVRIDSSQFDKIPARSYLVDGLVIRVPSNYNSITKQFDGFWDGTFVTAVSGNPAWVMFDVLTTERYGLGQFITDDDINKTRLYQIGKYCAEMVSDGFGGTEPRFEINTAIQTQAEAYKLIGDIASAFRGMAFWAGSEIGFMQDAPTDASILFNNANVEDGEFNYTGSSRKDRHSVVLVTWNDASENYKQKVEYVEDQELMAKYGIRQMSTIAFGCTSRGQAHRVGRWILYTERYESDMIQFKVGLDAANLIPGEVGKIHDQFKAGKRMGGRLLAATLNSATLDSEIELEGGGAFVSIRMADGTFVDRLVTQGAGTHSLLSWVSALPALPVSNALYIVSEASLEPMQCRILGIAQDRTDPTKFNITALEHYPSKFAAVEEGLVLDIPVTSVLNSRDVATPSELAIAEVQYAVAPGIVGLRLDLSWVGPAAYYEVAWSRSGIYQTNSTPITTIAPSIELLNVREGVYDFTVIGYNMIGAPSQPLHATYTPTGQMTAPGDVGNFQITQRRFDLLMTWDAVTDIGVVTYEIREGGSWDGGRVVVTNYSGTTFPDDQSQPGAYYYHIRSINAGGVYSANVSTVSVVLSAPATVTGFDCVQSGDRIEFRWNANAESNIDTYEIREGSNWASGTLVVQNSGTTHSMQAGSISGERTFWIKSIASPGIESALGAFVIVGIAAPLDRNVIVQYDERASGWLGSKYNVTVAGGDLVLDAGEAYGEYTFGIELPAVFRARNSILSSFDAVVADTEQWVTATYQWSHVQANRPWQLSGDIGSVDLNYQISKFVGLDVSYVDGFSLNGTTTGENGTVATEAIGVTYGPGRFLLGAILNDLTRLNWTVAVPEEFNSTFWFSPNSLSGNRVLWSAVTATGLQLICGTSEIDSVIYLEDTLGNRQTVAVWPGIGDRVLIGISQTATTRRLHAGIVNEAPVSSSALFAPLGAFTSVRTHQ